MRRASRSGLETLWGVADCPPVSGLIVLVTPLAANSSGPTMNPS